MVSRILIVLRCTHFVILSAMILIASGCAIHTLTPEFDLPSQDVTCEVGNNLTRVVFFNTSNKLMYGTDGSGKINISLNGKALASLKIGQYVQVFLEQGTYELLLAHRDVFTFKSNHKVNIAGDNLFFKVYSQPTSTYYQLVDDLPKDFSAEYEPVL